MANVLNFNTADWRRFSPGRPMTAAELAAHKAAKKRAARLGRKTRKAARKAAALVLKALKRAQRAEEVSLRATVRSWAGAAQKAANRGWTALMATLSSKLPAFAVGADALGGSPVQPTAAELAALFGNTTPQVAAARIALKDSFAAVEAVVRAEMEADERLTVSLDAIEMALPLLDNLEPWDALALGLEAGGGVDAMPSTFRKAAKWLASGAAPIPVRIKEAAAAGRLKRLGEGALEAGFPAGFEEKCVKVPGVAQLAEGDLVVFGRNVDRKVRKEALRRVANLAAEAVDTPRAERKASAAALTVLTASKMLTEALSAGTFDEKAVRKLSFLLGGRMVGNCVVFKRSREEIVVDLKAMKATLNGQELELRSWTALNGTVDGFKGVTTPWKTLFLLVAYALEGQGRKVASGRLAFLTNAWVEHTPGAAESSALTAKQTNKVGFVAIRAGHGYAMVLDNDSSADSLASVSAQLLNAGIPVAAHHQGNWLTVGDGATAMGVGFNPTTGEAVFMIVADKDTKVLNRVVLNCKAGMWSPKLVENAIGFKAASGEVLTTKGIVVSVALLHSSLPNSGSGPVLTRPGFAVTIGCERVVLKAAVNADGLKGDAAIAYAKGVTEIAKRVTWKQAAIEIHETTAVAWDMPFADGVRVGDPEWLWNQASGQVEVQAFYRWESESTIEKWANLGFKGTMMTEEVWFADLDGNALPQPDGTAGTEVAKGVTAALNLWAQARGGVVIDPNIGLTAEQQADFGVWLKENTKLERVTRALKPEAYARFKRLYGNDPAWSFDTCGMVSHTCEVTRGDMVVVIEHTSALEAAGDSQLFPELLLGLDLVDEEVARRVWSDPRSRARRGSKFGMLNSVWGLIPEGVKHVELSHDSECKALGLKQDELKGSAKSVLSALGKKHPKGAYIVAGKAALYVNFKALEAEECFMPGGVTTGAVAEIVSLVRMLATPVADRAYSFVALMQSNLFLAGTKMEALIKPGGALAKGLRAGTLLTRKVRTSDSIRFETGKAYVNPEDPFVRIGALNEGDYVAIGRTPMISLAGFELCLDETVGIGSIVVDAYRWSAGNGGDADGDGCFIFTVRGKDAEETAAIVARFEASLNNSIIGEAGYAMAYGPTLATQPFKDFVECPAKKSFFFEGSEKKSYTDAVWKNGEVVFNGYRLSAAALVEAIEAVTSHYREKVSYGYALASRSLYNLSRQVAKGRSQGTPVDARFYEACNWAWRVAYEDLGLSGYNPDGVDFWTSLDEHARKFHGYGAAEKAAAVEELYNQLVDLGGAQAPSKPALALILAYAMQHRLAESSEKGKKAPEGVNVGNQEAATLFGFLRRAGKGLLAPGSESAQVETLVLGRAHVQKLSNAIVSKYVAPGLLHDIATTAIELHQAVGGFMVERKGREDARREERMNQGL